MSIRIFADGASKGNPGEAAIGAVAFELVEGAADISLSQFKENEKLAIFKVSEKIGKKTNNEAEYMAVIKALEICQNLSIDVADVYLDSKLVVEQVKGNYKVKTPHLKPFHARILELIALKNIHFQHIPREKNSIADFLANRAYE